MRTEMKFIETYDTITKFQKLVDDHKKISHKTYADIAKEMGCSVRTLRRKLHDISEIKVKDAIKLIQILDIELKEENNEEGNKKHN